MMQAGALTAWELCCQRGDRLLFGGLELAMAGGDALMLIGPNGVGKTSLLRILAGLLPHSPTGLPSPPGARDGSVAWQGGVALLDERSALDQHLPLGRALAFWQRIDRGGSLPIDRLGLRNLLDVPVGYLSTGQLRRAALARVIGQRAENWLLDEPLNGLDADGMALLNELIAEHRADGGTVVLASHHGVDLPGASRLDLRDYPG